MRVRLQPWMREAATPRLRGGHLAWSRDAGLHELSLTLTLTPALTLTLILTLTLTAGYTGAPRRGASRPAPHAAVHRG